MPMFSLRLLVVRLLQARCQDPQYSPDQKTIAYLCMDRPGAPRCLAHRLLSSTRVCPVWQAWSRTACTSTCTTGELVPAYIGPSFFLT